MIRMTVPTGLRILYLMLVDRPRAKLEKAAAEARAKLEARAAELEAKRAFLAELEEALSTFHKDTQEELLRRAALAAMQQDAYRTERAAALQEKQSYARWLHSEVTRLSK